MNAARATILAGVIAGACSAANAWFFFIPGSVISAVADKAAGVEGDHCVNTLARVGESIRLVDGAQWRVLSLSGTSERCQNTAFPIRAKLERLYTDAEIQAEQTLCVPQGRSAGSTVRDHMGREMQVVRLSAGGSCPSPNAPVEAVVKLGPNTPRVLMTSAPAADPPPTSSGAARGSSPAPEAHKSIADRLRELKQLREENLITQDVYEAKQRDILTSQ